MFDAPQLVPGLHFDLFVYEINRFNLKISGSREQAAGRRFSINQLSTNSRLTLALANELMHQKEHITNLKLQKITPKNARYFYHFAYYKIIIQISLPSHKKNMVKSVVL